jgi:hypothetical protein
MTLKGHSSRWSRRTQRSQRAVCRRHGTVIQADLGGMPDKSQSKERKGFHTQSENEHDSERRLTHEHSAAFRAELLTGILDFSSLTSRVRE